MQEPIIHAGKSPWVVKTVHPREDFYLELTFADGKRGLFDARPLLEKKHNALLRDVEFFMKAHIFGDSVIWNDEIDVAPEYLYEHVFDTK